MQLAISKHVIICALSCIMNANVIHQTRSPAVAEGPRDAGVPVEILSADERLYYTPNEYRSRVCVNLTAYVKSIHIATT